MSGRTRVGRLVALAVLGSVSFTRAGTYDASPEVLSAIRLNYQAVTRMASEGRMFKLTRTFDCLNVFDAVRTAWKDGRGVIRKYTTEGGSEDSALTVSQYYGPDGRLSFALVQAGAVNGTQVETRLYYGPAGNLLREDERTVHGPGYPFGPPARNVVQFPDVAFGAPRPCP
ncbi:hypothetical protein [Deinococcus altitudinis]|uniref:hypothetical protein n=1 Tax=Deinococcus altitudinis TaxID=468914 RepID=UPI003892064F